jgi:probable F420-dependent oxidoreductase
MRIALVVGGRSFKRERIPELIEIARTAEEAGIDYLSVAEHLVISGHPNLDNFPAGRFMHTPDESFPEPVTLFAAIGAATKRIKLMTGIVIAPLRPAVFLAKQAATTHFLTGGRFVLGVSTSWQEEEYNALGVPYKERGQVLEDQLGAMRALWAGAPASFNSKTVKFEDMSMEPRPDDAEAIPIWIGGKCTPRLVRRVARYGQGWMPFGAYAETWDAIGEHVRQLKAATEAAGRDPAKLDVSYAGGFQQPFEERLPHMAKAGVTVAQTILPGGINSAADARPALESIARSFEPYRKL